MTQETCNSVTVSETNVEALRDGLARRPGTLFAILDATDAPQVPTKVAEFGHRAVSLYRGSAERDYWAVAPYLVSVDEAVLDWILKELWDDPWGIFARAETDLPSLRKHFRRFLVVLDPDGRQIYFRFYDPRVLPPILQSFIPDEMKEFFGPVEEFDIALSGSRIAAFQPLTR